MGSTMEIKILNTTQLFLIDDDDWERVKRHIWRLHPDGYAYTKICNRVTLLHRFVMQTPIGLQVDHIHGIRWDNRKSQLRNCSAHDNQMNKTQKNTQAGWRNISIATSGYQVRFRRRPNKQFSLGTYKTLTEAQTARDSYLIRTEPQYNLIKPHFHAN